MNYTQIKSKVADYVDRQDMLTTVIPDIVNMVLHDLEQDPEINWKHMEVKQTGTVTSSNDKITIPTRYKETKSLFLKGSNLGNRRLLLEKTSYLNLMIKYPDDENAKTVPAEYALSTADSSIILRPYPDTNYDYEWITYNYSTDLSGDTDTNWFTNYAWELLVYGSMLELEPYIRNPERLSDMPIWQGLYTRRLNKLKAASASEDWAGSYQRVNFNGIPE